SFEAGRQDYVAREVRFWTRSGGEAGQGWAAPCRRLSPEPAEYADGESDGAYVRDGAEANWENSDGRSGFRTGEGGRTLKRTLLAALAGGDGGLWRQFSGGGRSSGRSIPLSCTKKNSLGRCREWPTAAGVLSVWVTGRRNGP